MKTLYYSLVHPHITYGIHLWGNTLQKHINSVWIAQKKCIRAISCAKYNQTTSPLFQRHKILKFQNLYNVAVGAFVYKFVNKLHPDPLLSVFNYHGDIHRHNTRTRTDPRVPNANSNIMRKSFLYTAPSSWMLLGDALKNSESLKTFKRSYKRNLIFTY